MATTIRHGDPQDPDRTIAFVLERRVPRAQSSREPASTRVRQTGPQHRFELIPRSNASEKAAQAHEQMTICAWDRWAMP